MTTSKESTPPISGGSIPGQCIFCRSDKFRGRGPLIRIPHTTSTPEGPLMHRRCIEDMYRGGLD